MTLCLSATELLEITGKVRPSAQARFLRRRWLRVLYTVRDDGSLALRRDEIDRWTLSKPNVERPEKPLDLSLLRKAA